MEVIAVQQNLEELVLTSCLHQQESTEALFIQLVHTQVFQTIKKVNIRDGWNLDKDESCELFADLLAKAPKIEEVKLGRYSSGSRLVHTDIKYAKESEPGVIPDNKMGLIRVYKV